MQVVKHHLSTGNLGGEKYPDKARSMLNEGGLFAEVSKMS